jgi:hypothetical protein
MALGARDARVEQRQLDVVERGRARQQVELLEHEADLAVADRRERVAVERLDVLAVERYAPDVAMSRQPITFMNVDLPEPDGPITATNSPRPTSTRRRRARARRCRPSGRP